MRSLLILLLTAAPLAAADPPTLRARAALALAFAADPPATYPEQYARAVRAGKPLVVWVGQPARAVPGCVLAECPTFPAAGPEAVVVGVPAGAGFRRVDLPGRPTDAALLAAVRSAAP